MPMRLVRRSFSAGQVAAARRAPRLRCVAAGRSSGARSMRMAAGTVWSSSSSSVATPSTSSIAASSSAVGPMWRPTKSSSVEQVAGEGSGAVMLALRWRVGVDRPALSWCLRASTGRVPAFPVGEPHPRTGSCCFPALPRPAGPVA